MKIKEQPIMGYLIVTVIAVMIALVILMDDRESPDQAYERGKIDGQAPDTMETYVTMELIPPSEVIRQVTGDDTLYFRRKKVGTGYVLTPIYIVFKPWLPYRSDWREEWLDTSRGWYGFEISEEFARAWYDDKADMKYEATFHGVVTLYSTESDYWYNTVVSDSTDTMPTVEGKSLEPLYEKIIYSDCGSFSVYPPDTTFGDYLVNSCDIDRIDTVRVPFVDSVMYDWRGKFAWVAIDDSTLGRYYTVGDDKGNIVGFYREQVHLR